MILIYMQRAKNCCVCGFLVKKLVIGNIMIK